MTNRLTAILWPASLALVTTPNNVMASNFGDLPSVAPIFFLCLMTSFFVAFAMAMKRGEDQQLKKFKLGIFLLILFLGFIVSFVVLIVAWLLTI